MLPTNTEKKEELKDKREAMTRESWIKNVLRIYPDKTRQQAEELHDKLFRDTLKQQQ